MLLRLLRRSFGAGGQGDRGAAGRRVPLALPLVFVPIFLTAQVPRQRPRVGRLHLDREEAAAAAELLRKAVQIDPHQFTGRHLLGQAYQMLGKTEEAQEQLRLAKKTQTVLDELSELTRRQAAHPLDAKQHLRMAELYQQLDMTPMAERNRRFAAMLDPTLAVPAKAP